MITTLFDPNQFGARFFYGQKRFPKNLFTDLSEINCRPMIPMTGSERPVEKRFDELKCIVEHLVEDLHMPISAGSFQKDNGEFKHLLDYCRGIGAWMAFAVFLEYFQVEEYNPEYILAGNQELSMFRPGPHLNADLPFSLSQLLPHITFNDLLRAIDQFRNMKASIAKNSTLATTSDTTIFPTLFNMLEEKRIEENTLTQYTP